MSKSPDLTRRAALASATAAFALPAFAQPPGRQTPGVYINEIDAFPNAVAGVETSVVAFVGPAGGEAGRFESFATYLDLHGETEPPRFALDGADLRETGSTSLMERSVRWFFDNGGRAAHAVGASLPEEPLTLQAMLDALAKAADQPDVSLLAAPDAIRLSPEDCIAFQQAMLAQCEALGDRFAILDVHPDMAARGGGGANGPLAAAAAFGTAIGTAGAAFGAAYIPMIRTSLVAADSLSFLMFDDLRALADLLIREDTTLGADIRRSGPLYEELAAFDAASPLGGDPDVQKKADLLHRNLSVASRAYGALLDRAATLRSLMPASAGVAGVYARTDSIRGVWKAPANEALANTLSPSLSLGNQESSLLNTPASGPPVNAIRAFPNRGTLIWGARTLDAADVENRYVNVRRTMIFLKSSIENALRPYVFEPNDANTWANVRSMTSSFLHDLWTQGAMAGASPEDAFAVQCALGLTMTQQDILDGRLRMRVLVALTRPAEFQVLDFDVVVGVR